MCLSFMPFRCAPDGIPSSQRVAFGFRNGERKKVVKHAHIVYAAAEMCNIFIGPTCSYWFVQHTHTHN